MKNAIVVLMVLLANKPVFAQLDPAKITRSTNFFQTENKNRSLIHNNKQWDSKRFMELYNQYHAAGKNTAIRPVTFMDGPVVFSVTPTVEINKNANTLYQRYSAAGSEQSAALQLLGIAAGIAAGAAFPKYSNGMYINAERLDRTRYLDSRAAIEAAYLQSTYRRHD